MTFLFLAFILSFMLVAVMLPRILILSLRKKLVDPIDARKVHSVPASRLGGVAFFPAIIFAVWMSTVLSYIFYPFSGAVVPIHAKMLLESLSLLMLFLIGIYDDILGVSYRKKFVAQIVVAVFIIASGTYFKTFHGFLGINHISGYIGLPITILFYVFVTNSINLIDGIDGLASLLSIMALIVFTALLYKGALIEDSLLTIATLGALIPFCYSNVFGIKKGARSKIFMGDTGALVIGAILGMSAVKIWNITPASDSQHLNPLFYVLAYTMLLIPCFDVIRIVLHRYRAKKPLFMPDKNHIHHKFMALGCNPHQALMFIILVNLIFMVINIAMSYFINFTFIVAIDAVVWTLMHLKITQLIKQKSL